MANCYRVQRMLSSYLDRELSDSDRALVEAHSKTCPACRTRLNDTRALRSSLSALPKVKTTPTFDAVFQSRLRREISRFRPFWIPHELSLVGKAALFAMGAVLFFVLGMAIDRSLNSESGYSESRPMLESASRTAGTDTEGGKIRVKNYVLEDRSQVPISYDRGLFILGSGLGNRNGLDTLRSEGELETIISPASQLVHF